jgi:chromosome segregation ATPase
MEQYRVIQIMQELINDKNNELYQLNNYLNEAQSNSWSYVNPQDYQNMVNEKDMAWSQVGSLQSQLMSVQQNYDNLVANSNNSSAELEAMRSVLDAVRADRDAMQAILDAKDANLNSALASVDQKAGELSTAQNAINDLNGKISEQNTIITDLNGQLNTKQEEVVSLKQKLSDIESKLLSLKSKIKAEMEEATSEVEEAFDETNLID